MDHMDEDGKVVFTPRLMVLFCRSRTVNSFLVRTRLYPFYGMIGSCNSKNKINDAKFALTLLKLTHLLVVTIKRT